ncbi:MAG: rod shape-determining protein MreC [Oscillospiraceae bacterium]|nr:rod shape-determining protein MreC [Oscillospiraceae bacterium]
MKKVLLTKRSIIIASISLFLALVTLVSAIAFSSAGPVTGVANTITRPVRALSSTVARTFGNIFASIYRYEELENRYEELLRSYVRLQMDVIDTAAIVEENESLRMQLDLRDRNPNMRLEQVTLESMNSDNWTSTFTINRGYANSEVRQGTPVSTEYGVLIGQVSEVGATSSVVITVLDTKFSAAAFVGGDTREDADGTVTVKGDFLQMRNGLLIIDHIDDDLNILTGASVFTSGLGGVFPSGLHVGEVVAVDTHANGIGRYATVRPSRDIETVQNIFIIIDFENPE